MIRLAVVGAGGQLGQAVVAIARHQGHGIVAISRGSDDPDLRADLLEPQSVRGALEWARPSHIVLTAAATDVAWCEREEEGSRAVNVVGTAQVVAAARDLNAPLAFISTDYVFDGESGPYDETATPNPINVYGRHKLEAERLVLDASGANLVVRTCQLFGPDLRRKNFVLRLVDQARAGGVTNVATDLYGTPTFGPDLAAFIVDAFVNGVHGLAHVAGDRFLSRAAFAWLVADAFGLDASLIREAPATPDGVPRPRRSGLVSRVVLTPLEVTLQRLAHAA